VIFFVNAALPVSVPGCATRGLAALSIAEFSGLAGLVTVLIVLIKLAYYELKLKIFLLI
jgi:hypothetical protein